MKIFDATYIATLQAAVTDLCDGSSRLFNANNGEPAAGSHLGVGNQSFYTRSGLMRAKRHLASGGTLAVWSYAESSPFVDALRAAFAVVEVVPVSYVNDLVDEERTDWLFLARDEWPEPAQGGC